MTDKLPVKTFRLKKGKIRGLHLTGFACLAAAGIFIACNLSTLPKPGSPLLHLLTFTALGVCAFCIVGCIRLGREHFIGLFISERGLNDVSTGHDYGVVEWKDVRKIKVMEDLSRPERRYIVLMVANPQEYIGREPNSRKKRSMILKLHYYGSPICFSTRGLDCTFEELEETVNTYYGHSKEGACANPRTESLD